MGRFEDALKSLRERFDTDDLPEELETLEQYKGTDLRKKAERTDQLEQELEAVKAENRRLKTAPKITEALKKAGVDFEALRPAEVEKITALEFEGDEPAEDWVAKLVSDYDFPMTEGAGSGTEGEPEAAKIARHARNAPAGGGTVSGTITPETVAGWPRDKRLRFRKEHPDAWKTLKEGGVVSGIAFA